MASTPSQFRDQIKRDLFFTNSATDDTTADLMIARPACRWVTNKTTTDAAGTTAYRIVLDPGLDLQTLVSSVTVVSNTNATFNGTNFATIQLVYNDGAAGSDVVVGTVDTSAVSFVAKIGRLMALTAANVLIPAGKQLEVVITKAGTGIALDAISVIVKGFPV